MIFGPPNYIQVSLLTQQSAEKDNLLKTTEAVQLQLRQQIAEKDQFIEGLQEGFRQQKDQFIQMVRSEKEGLRQQIAEKDGFMQSLQSEKEGLKQQIVEKDQFIESLQEGFRQQKDQFIQIVRSEKEGLRQQIAEKDHCIQSLESEKEGLRQQIAEKDQLIQSLQNDKEGLSQQIAEKDRFIQSVQREKEGLRQQVATLGQQVQRNTPQPQSEQSYQSKFWEVPREEISLNMQKILGTGAWGFVVEGTFRGQQVAVKCLHDMIQEPEYIGVIRKEIGIMAQIRHPNLVLLIAAVIEAENGPLIITELLDMSLRKAYEKNLIKSSSKLNIVRDIASALNYLHLHHHGEIIHRDVSSANVLLEAKPNNQWKAKLSDFGSAKLAMEAKTKGPGAPVYAAPEVKREMGISQTAKVDVYSYGILVCEVTMGQFPMEKRLPNMLEAVRDRWVFIHGLITACIQEHPDNRPTMSYVLVELNKLQPN